MRQAGSEHGLTEMTVDRTVLQGFSGMAARVDAVQKQRTGFLLQNVRLLRFS